MHVTRKRNVLTIVLAVGIAIASPAWAQVNAVWDGDSGVDVFWLNGDNWAGGTAPNGASDVANFDQTGVSRAVDMNGQALTVLDMFISGTADGYDISNGALTVSNSFTHSASGTNTFSGALTVGSILLPGTMTVSGGVLHLSNASSDIVGETTITRGALDLGDLSVNAVILANSHLEFASADEETGAIFIAHGTGANKFDREIRSGAGNVGWARDTNGGGFAARGGPLEVSLESGRELDWSTSSRGFRGNTLGMGHSTADNVVTLLNDIEVDSLDTGTPGIDFEIFPRNVIVYDNHATDADVAVFGGLVVENAADRWLAKRVINNDTSAYNQSGTLWLANTGNTHSNTQIQGGAVRLTQDDGGIGVYKVQFFADGHDQPAVIESKGTFERTIGNDTYNDLTPEVGKDQIHWAATFNGVGDGRGGGFAAYGGPLTVVLHPNSAPATTNLQWGSEADGFNGLRLHLGSYTANDVVTFTSNIDGGNGNREIWVYDNPHQTTDR